VQIGINAAIKKDKDFHKNQMEKSWSFKGQDGETLGQRIRPLKRVGLYVPGGAGAYPSTVIMNAVPAMVAGVQDIVVTTPSAGGLNPAVAYTIQKLAIQEVYKIGGAQAVGLLAYGAGKITGVDKIVGPANVYAALAKKEVFGTVDIDMIAGPSEILVMFDETADPDWIAADLLSQAEHGSGYEAAIGITTSLQAAEWVKECVIQQVEQSPKRKLLEEVLKRFGRIFIVQDWEQGIALSDAIAPEHLEIIAKDEVRIADEIQNAGAIFIGAYSSEPVGDYFAGPNHVLPTNGTSRFSSPLGVYDFLKRTSIIHYNKKAMEKHGKKIAAIADYEGFFHHAEAVRKRL
jgi:histidinol dehydrogenase